ncbi:hypothetical protein O181_029170 [Austropuccinia psidii MF-1]|uniref:Uncharacterized protein n=1 Tax=Austropuccinia psidii MF-1 TaxID=1389203 RepID=A0A9Q3CUR2_9BASI|nr:hypothetical protein [Austropuccinia psidii MF-1]
MQYLTGAVGTENLVPFFQNDNDGAKLSRYVTWIMVPLAERHPQTHEKQLQLLKALQPLDTFKERCVNELRYQLNEMALSYGDPSPSAAYLRTWWTNINRFAALIHKAELVNFSEFAQRTLDYALKERSWRESWGVEGRISSDLRALDGHASAAMHWLLECGHSLYPVTTIEQSWSQWKENLEWIVSQASLSDAIRKVCQRGLDKMNEISRA